MNYKHYTPDKLKEMAKQTTPINPIIMDDDDDKITKTHKQKKPTIVIDSAGTQPQY